LVPKFQVAVTNQAEIQMEIDWSEDGEEIEYPKWWNNLDTTKGIGYPARDTARILRTMALTTNQSHERSTKLIYSFFASPKMALEF
jgi:hypothetical protein